MKHQVLCGAILCLSLFGCDSYHYEEKCVDGKTYFRTDPQHAWKLLDAAPNHKGITPTPCVMAPTQGGKP